MKIVPKFRKEVKELDVWDDDIEVENRGKIVEELAKRFFKSGYSEMETYRQLGLSRKEDWEWLRSVKDSLL